MIIQNNFKKTKKEKFITAGKDECFVYVNNLKNKIKRVPIKNVKNIKDVILCSRCECVAAKYLDIMHPIYNDFTLCEDCNTQINNMQKLMDDSVTSKIQRK